MLKSAEWFAGITLIALGMGTFAYGVYQHLAYTPVLMIGLAVMGMGMGCTMMPVSGSALVTLRAHEVARGATLINVDQQIAGSIGTALMSMILTNQFNRSPYVVAANEAADARMAGGPPPPQVLAPDFMARLTDDLSRAYTVVFVVAVCLVVATLIPAAFLPKKPATETSGQTATSTVMH